MVKPSTANSIPEPEPDTELESSKLPNFETEPPGMSQLLRRMQEIENGYFNMCRVAAERYELEHNAARTLQRWARGYIVRRNLKDFNSHALFCQRIWRGYLGRCRYVEHLKDFNHKLRMEYFDRMATRIQRLWRGHLSRKHVHSFYARRRYLEEVARKNAETRAMLDEEFWRSLEQQKRSEEERARTRFGSTISQMHHLVSTFSQPGIFNSPYLEVSGGAPKVASLPIEEHLQRSARGALAKQRAGKKRRGKLPPATERPPASFFTKSGRLAPLKSGATTASPNLTLQASVPYKMVHDEMQFEELLGRSEILSMHPHQFVTTIQAPVPERHRHFQLPALKNDTEFMETHDILLRPAVDSLDARTTEVHPDATRPFLTQPGRQAYFQDTLNLQEEYLRGRAGVEQPAATD